MYRYGENPIKQRHRHVAVLVVGAVILLGAAVWAIRFFHSPASISPSSAVTSKVAAAPIRTQHIDEPLFSFDLPQDWKADTTSSTANKFIWSNTGQDAGTRALVVYADSDQSSLGLNRAISVQSYGDHLTTTSDVSDNCAGFTSKPDSGQTIATPAKWNGLDFLCDLGNYERNVVGTVSQDGINKIAMTGKTTGGHSIFFTYTDNGSESNYTTFVNALQSFRLK